MDTSRFVSFSPSATHVERTNLRQSAAPPAITLSLIHFHQTPFPLSQLRLHAQRCGGGRQSSALAPLLHLSQRLKPERWKLHFRKGDHNNGRAGSSLFPHFVPHTANMQAYEARCIQLIARMQPGFHFVKRHATFMKRSPSPIPFGMSGSCNERHAECPLPFYDCNTEPATKSYRIWLHNRALCNQRTGKSCN